MTEEEIYSGPTAPLQTTGINYRVPLIVAAEGYKEYTEKYGMGQSFDRLNERGGFGARELAVLLFQRIKRLEAEILKGGGK